MAPRSPSEQSEAVARGYLIVREQRTEELVEGLSVTRCDDSGRDRGDRRGARHGHRQRDLAEVIARPQQIALSHDLVRPREHAGEDHIEAIALVALPDDR